MLLMSNNRLYHDVELLNTEFLSFILPLLILFIP